jgi:type IV pilus assembly protein PilW
MHRTIIPPSARIAMRRERGLTLVELMVSLVIGLILVIAMSALFVSSSTTRREVELSADVIENGRYGLDTLSRELSQAGFYGPLVTPTGATVDICSTDVAAVWTASLTIHAVGLNNLAADPACLTRKAGTDAIFVQRASTCYVGETGCEAENASNAYLQVSECGAEYSTTPFVLAAGGVATPFVLQTKACDGTKAPKRKLIRRIYYISTDDILSYVDITLGGASTPVGVVENIEQLQIEYAVDSTGDGTADSFSSTPADWSQVIGARVWLLARSSSPSKNTNSALSFPMGDTTFTVTANANGNQKRRVYSTYIPFVTPKSRRES